MFVGTDVTFQYGCILFEFFFNNGDVKFCTESEHWELPKDEFDEIKNLIRDAIAYALERYPLEEIQAEIKLDKLEIFGSAE